ncbi:glycosyl transferase [Yeosuana aromativorans]|uniref:Glycosyl transferase n=1 Tax=Yeosuana aromativorans TaxID=288019 RepID=A0A8J3FJG7_9FLAO|nr:glycosyltransferase family 4 protein [Yeosuana aromativorans]GGK29046.1 glycosyl transferase [Yeosuana aromativorans]
MKIVFIIDQVYRHGGIERVLSIKANYLSKLKNFDIHIITTEQKNNESCYSFNDLIKFKDLNINYHRNKSYFHPKNLIKVPSHILKINAALKTINPNTVVVCSHSVDTYFLPFIRKKIPKIKEFHYSKFIEVDKRTNQTSFFKKLFFKFADFVESKYDKLVILNRDEAHYYKSNNIKIIPNPLTFYPENVSPLQNPKVISAGRIAPVKRFDTLIDIWELVYKKNQQWQLHIYGNGEPDYIEFLQSKIKEKKLSDHVFLKGATSDIQNKMLHSSLFVMTSDNECFPLVLLEAQACGLPIISFDCPNGPRNIIKADAGKLIMMQDVIGFSESILNMISNPDELNKYGSNARRHAQEFKVESIMELWIQLFKELNH